MNKLSTSLERRTIFSRRWHWVAVFAAVAGVMLLPAAYNRFPLIFPDTATYVGAAYEQRWPLDRSGFYGLFFRPLLLLSNPLLGVWLTIVAQALIVTGVVIGAARRIAPRSRPLTIGLLIIALAFVTTLSWHTAQLMPDAFTGPLILAIWLAASRDLERSGTALLWLLAAVLMLFHYTHIGLVLAGLVACLAVCALNGTNRVEIGKRAIAGTLTIAAVAAAHITIHGTYFGRWTISPMGGHFLFARLNEDGLVPLWLDRHCGQEASKALCDLRPQIPRDSQVLLWGDEASPFYERVNLKIERDREKEAWPWIDAMNQAAIGSIKEQPIRFLQIAAKQTIDQFLHFAALDDECPKECKSKVWFEYRPTLEPSVQSSRQLRDEIARGPIRAVTSAAAILGLLLLIPMALLAVRRRDRLAQSLIATVVTCLIANAAMAGALSDVHDRYQSRVVWLAPFVVLLLAARWRNWGSNSVART
jgi:hypothetical protein